MGRAGSDDHMFALEGFPAGMANEIFNCAQYLRHLGHAPGTRLA